MDLYSVAMMFSLACLRCTFWPYFLLFFLITWDSLIWYFENCLQWCWALFGVITESCLFFHFGITWHILKAAFPSPLHFPIIVFWGLSAAHFYQFVSLISFVHHNSPVTQIMFEHVVYWQLNRDSIKLHSPGDTLSSYSVLYFHYLWIHRRISLLTP